MTYICCLENIFFNKHIIKCCKNVVVKIFFVSVLKNNQLCYYIHTNKVMNACFSRQFYLLVVIELLTLAYS